MRAAALTAYGQPLELLTLPDPAPPPDGVVVRVLACGICRSDWHVWHGDWQWRMTLAFPHILGHECAGEIVALGALVRGWRAGDRVVVPFHLNCGACDRCARGQSNLCHRYTAIGFQAPGAFAELLAVPAADRNLVRLPPGLDPALLAGLGCRLMSAWHGLTDQVPVGPGDRVAIYGGGGVGLAALLVARAAGAVVAVIDPDPAARSRAESCGAAAALAPEAAGAEALAGALGGLPNVTVDAVGLRATLNAALELLDRSGRHLQLGLSGAGDEGRLPVPVDHIVKAELQLVGSVGCPMPSYRRLVNAVAEGRLGGGGLAPRSVGLEGITPLLQRMSLGESAGLTVLTP